MFWSAKLWECARRTDFFFVIIIYKSFVKYACVTCINFQTWLSDVLMSRITINFTHNCKALSYLVSHSSIHFAYKLLNNIIYESLLIHSERWNIQKTTKSLISKFSGCLHNLRCWQPGIRKEFRIWIPINTRILLHPKFHQRVENNTKNLMKAY